MAEFMFPNMAYRATVLRIGIRTKLASLLWNFTWHIPIIHFDSYLILLYRAAQMWERIFFKVKPLSDESLMYSTMLLSPVSRLKSWGFKSSPVVNYNLKNEKNVKKLNFCQLWQVQKNQIMDNNQRGYQFLYNLLNKKAAKSKAFDPHDFI